MANYEKELRVGENIYKAQVEVSNYLIGEGYKYVRENGVLLYKKTSGNFKDTSFFRFDYLGGCVKIESGLSMTVLSVELEVAELDGFVASGAKQELKNTISHVESIFEKYTA